MNTSHIKYLIVFVVVLISSAITVNTHSSIYKEECATAAINKSRNPQTVEFSYFFDFQQITYPDGETIVKSTFTDAGFEGQQFKNSIHCRFKRDTLRQVVIKRI